MLAAPSTRSSASARKRTNLTLCAAPAPPTDHRRLTRSARTNIVAAVNGRHLFVCTNARGGGKPACGPRGGDALVVAVQRELVVRGATDAQVTPCGCLGPCFDGPNAVVYPDGVWYGGLDVADAPALADHLVGGAPLAHRRTVRPGTDR
jgi:(2Fe-2S) ferredoxin